jgi:hypothetical protein
MPDHDPPFNTQQLAALVTPEMPSIWLARDTCAGGNL